MYIRYRVLFTLLIMCFTYSLKADQNHHNEMEVIEVVAQKRKQNMQNVGISLTALTENKLSQLGLVNTVDITQQVPNLQLNTWSPNLTIFNLRGVSQNSFTDNFEAPVAVYIDDSYIGSLNAISGQLFDMQRVEVLRGPQGTLFGRNATGGLVHYLTRSADEDYANGYVKLNRGSFDHTLLEAAYGGKLIENVRGRIAIHKDRSDGYIKSHDSNIRAVGGTNNLSVKSAFQWDIQDDLQLELLYKYSKDDNVPTGGYAFLPWGETEINNGYIPSELMDFTQNVILDGAAPPDNLTLREFTQNVFFNTTDGFTPVNEAGLTLYQGDHTEPHKHFSNIDGYLDRQIDNVTFNLRWEVEPELQFHAISNFNTLEKRYLEDGDGTPAPIISFQTDMDYQQLSQELRLSGASDKLVWQVGAYYLSMEHDGEAITTGNPVIRLANTLINNGEIEADYDPALGAPQARQKYKINSMNWSLFSQVELKLLPELVAISGLRWSKDKKSINYFRGFQDLSSGIPLIQQASIGPDDDFAHIDYQDYAAKLQFNWQVSAKSLIYASYNRGIKVGNWSLSAGVPVEELQHKPETLHAYELGFKKSIPELAMRVNSTAFFYNYNDYQVFSMAGLSPQIDNSDAEVSGAEIEFSWQLNSRSELEVGASYLDSNVEKVNSVAKWNSPVGGTVIDFPIDNLYNVQLPNAPKFSINYLYRYQLPVFNNAFTAQIDGVYYDDQYLEVTNGGGAYQKAYGVTNMRVNLNPENTEWEISLWMKNVTDEVYKQYSLDLGMLGATAYYAQPRTSGITVIFNF